MSTVRVTAAVADLVTLTDPTDAPIAAEGREAPHVCHLVDAARHGSREAFDDLVALHQRVVFRTAMAALRAREDAEDAAQEAFVLAWRNIGAFRGDSTFRTWLLTIVWRKALDKRRQRHGWWARIRPSTPPGDGLERPVEAVAATDPDPERSIVAQDLARHARRAIAGLSPKLRDTLLLAATGEHSYDQIAVMLGVPVGTVKWRVAEARRLVSERMPNSAVRDNEADT
jgi:RNA polymerase sigma-70 factor (ECF subfamily)